MCEDSRLGGYRYTLAYGYNIVASAQDDEISFIPDRERKCLRSRSLCSLRTLGEEETDVEQLCDYVDCVVLTVRSEK